MRIQKPSLWLNQTRRMLALSDLSGLPPRLEEEPVYSRMLMAFRNDNKKTDMKSKVLFIRVLESGRSAILGYTNSLRGDVNVADLSAFECEKFFFNKLEGGLGGLVVLRGGHKFIALDRKGKIVYLDAVDRESREPFQTSFNCQIEGARDMQFICTEQRVIIGSQDKELTLYDLQTRTKDQVMTGHGAEISTVSSHPFMAMALTSSIDQTVKLWDLNSGTSFFTMTPHKTGVTRAKFHPDGLHFLTCGKDNTVQVLDIRKKGVVQSAPTKGEPKCLEISESFFVVGDSHGGIGHYDKYCELVDYARRDEGNAVLAMHLCEHSQFLIAAREKQQIVQAYGMGRDGKEKMELVLGR